MGGDGGSVPKRKERVKSFKGASKPDRDVRLDANERWKICPLSNNFIRKPVMAGQFGSLISKEGMLEFLIHVRNDSLQGYHIMEDAGPAVHWLRSRKDAVELKLVDNPDLDKNDPKWEQGDFVCPITGLETNGQHKFLFSWQCGCVISERAFKECKTDEGAGEKKCLVCEKPYEDFDIVIINPEEHEDLDRNQAAFMARQMAPYLRGEKDPKDYKRRRWGEPEESSSRETSFSESTGSSSKESRSGENEQAAGPSTSRSRPGSCHSSGSKRDRSRTPQSHTSSSSGSHTKRTK